MRAGLGHDKVALFGHSWGSALGVLYASRLPGKVAAYVGSGQIGDWAANERASYAWLMGELARRNDRAALATMHAIGAPPYDAEKLWTQRMTLARVDGLISARSLWKLLRILLRAREPSILALPTTMRAFRWSLDAMLKWPGYRAMSRVVSELSAIGAPTRALWIPLGIVYALLLMAFAVGVWRSAGASRALRVVAILLLVDGVADLAWPPMHMREALAAGQGSLTDTLHIAFTFVWATVVMVAMGFAAAAFGKLFRAYTIATMLILIVFGILTGTYSARIATNQPTPFVGLYERINIGAFMVWLAVLAMRLGPARDDPAPRAASHERWVTASA